MTRREWFPMAMAPLAIIGVKDHGATGKGQVLESPAFQKAMDAAAAAGGGTVHVPAGRYVCGTLRLRSNVTLWLDNGAMLVMSDKEADFAARETLVYDPKADQSTTFFRNGLLVGEDVHDIAIVGEGAIDCNPTKGLRPKPISLKKCTNVTVRGVTISRASSYNISMLGCDYVSIDSVTIRNGTSDGIDPDGCRYVRISNCFVESVDDAIVLKASLALGERRSCEHITVTNCVLRTASLFLKCGTESTGDFRNIAFSNCTLIGGMGNRHGNPGIGLYTVDGGTLEGVTISNITMQNVGIPIAIRRGARGRGQTTPQPGPLREVAISNLVATNAQRASVIAGLPDSLVENIKFSDISISMAEMQEIAVMPSAIPEKPSDYPDPTMFGNLPSSGLYIRHADGVTLRNVEIRPLAGDARAAILADDARSLRGYAVRTGRVWLNNVQHATWLDYERIGKGAAFSVSGAATEGITIRGVLPVEKAEIEISADVPKTALRAF